MYFIGIDVSRKTFHFFVSDSLGKRVTSGKLANEENAFVQLVSQYAADGVLVAIEVGNITFGMARAMRLAGAEVRVVNTYQNALIRKSMQKTDALDAKQLCEQLRLGQLPKHPVYIPTLEAEELRLLISSRAHLVRKRTAISNEMTRLADQHGVYLAKSALSREGGWDQLKLVQGSWSQLHKDFLETQYQMFSVLHTKIQSYDWMIVERVEIQHGEEMRLLDTIFGMGQTTIATFLAYVFPIDRFKNAREVCRYVGLSPAIRQSGDSKEPSRITKQGNALLRSYLTQTAIHVRRLTTDHPLRRWHDAVVKRRGWKKARVALGRKMVSIAFGVLKHRKPFDPSMLNPRMI